MSEVLTQEKPKSNVAPPETEEDCADKLKEEVVAALDGAAAVEEGLPLPATEAFTPVKPRKGFRYGCYRFFKRVFDVISAILMLILFSWFILLCLLIKWLEDFHNPVYVSTRVGKDGKEFKILKIRTMRPDAEKLKRELIEQGLNEAEPPAFKMKNDPRITRVGKIYRKFSIDELLQLFNIINGTMSVVGPRPPLPEEVASYTEYQKQRLQVKGGLLCLWQVKKNRNALPFDEWIKLDIEYIERQSAWLDIKIIFKGAFMVIFDHSGV